MNKTRVLVDYGTCDDCGTGLKSEVVTVTFKGLFVSRRAVIYCPNNDCPKERFD